MQKLILASTSTVHGSDFLEYLSDVLKIHFKDADEVLFIPYARPGGITHDDYTDKASQSFEKIGKQLIGIHTFNDPINAIRNSKGIFIGGGNTFVLLKQLNENNLVETLKKTINQGIPYLGTSAGTNITGQTIGTTNDMPIVYPPSFNALGLIPFNINPHYLDPDPNSTHMGETRETRIAEFHKFNSIPVVGLREGSYLEVHDDTVILKGKLSARIFKKDLPPYEFPSNSELHNL